MTKQAMRVWFGLFVALVFAAGVGTGVMVAERLAPLRGGAFMRGWPGGRPGIRGPNGGRPGRLAPVLAEELGLDADQQKKLADVFARRRGRLEAIQSDVRKQFEGEQKELREEIRAILRPDQMQKFEEWLRRSERRRPGGVPPPPGGPPGGNPPSGVPPGWY